MQIYVSGSVLRSGDGSIDHPFKTIQEAAQAAKAGDTVFVAPGIYREWVKPANSGMTGYNISARHVGKRSSPAQSAFRGGRALRTYGVSGFQTASLGITIPISMKSEGTGSSLLNTIHTQAIYI